MTDEEQYEQAIIDIMAEFGKINADEAEIARLTEIIAADGHIPIDTHDSVPGDVVE